MTSFTPGPWQSRGNETFQKRDYYVVASSGTKTVAYCRIGSAPNVEDEANARLIAAAPELLEALWVLTEHNALHFGESHNTVIQGRAVLAKVQP